jgi:hypothetical protein
VKDSPVSETTWTSADTSSRQAFQGSSVTSGGARTACMTSVNKVVHRLISRIIVWLLKSYVHLGRLPHSEPEQFLPNTWTTLFYVRSSELRKKLLIKKKKFLGLSQPADYTDRATDTKCVSVTGHQFSASFVNVDVSLLWPIVWFQHSQMKPRFLPVWLLLYHWEIHCDLCG